MSIVNLYQLSEASPLNIICTIIIIILSWIIAFMLFAKRTKLWSFLSILMPLFIFLSIIFIQLYTYSYLEPYELSAGIIYSIFIGIPNIFAGIITYNR